MKYFAIFDQNFKTIFQLQWKIRNISDMFLQYSVLWELNQFRKILQFQKLASV